jgi:hypothetical protein
MNFKFTLFFPDEFTQLWTKFGLKAEDLLISLTAKNLDGFENPAKSKSWMVTSRDKQMFLKSVQMESKYLLDSILEKDFFFNMQKDGNLQFWNGKDYSSTKGYKGGFAYYFQYMMQEGNSEGKNGESSMTTLLPKFYGLFAFQVNLDTEGKKNISKILMLDFLKQYKCKFCQKRCKCLFKFFACTKSLSI